MTQEELKTILTMNVNLDSVTRAELEMFFAEHNNVTVNNFQSQLNEWRESENGKKANAMITKRLNAEKESKIQHGLTTIEKGIFSYVNKTNRFGTYVVYDKITGLYGLVTENGEEVLPCIFDSVSVKLDGFIEVKFLGSSYDFMFSACEYEPKEDRFCYGENSAYIVCHKHRRDTQEQKLQHLIDLLKINHTRE